MNRGDTHREKATENAFAKHDNLTFVKARKQQSLTASDEPTNSTEKKHLVQFSSDESITCRYAMFYILRAVFEDTSTRSPSYGARVYVLILKEIKISGNDGCISTDRQHEA